MIEFMEHVRQVSNRDYLTDLYNRRYFFESGQLLYANALRNHLKLAIAMLDLDHFKQINDMHGHKAGDAVLQHVAWMLKKRFRQSDLVARFGGEEFCILATNMDERHVYRIFDEIRATLAGASIPVETTNIVITASIGVCTTLKRSLDEMITAADALLYQAKRQGRNRIICG
jgi:diguanylate cyclase (GGDEF)-like protein